MPLGREENQEPYPLKKSKNIVKAEGIKITPGGKNGWKTKIVGEGIRSEGNHRGKCLYCRCERILGLSRTNVEEMENKTFQRKYR